MSVVTVRIRDNGPLLIDGPIQLVDAQGRAIPMPNDKPVLAFCRCGQSNNKPFCDGTHRNCGFQSVCTAPQP
jgi:CDGSH-type Zn-finger protein